MDANSLGLMIGELFNLTRNCRAAIYTYNKYGYATSNTRTFLRNAEMCAGRAYRIGYRSSTYQKGLLHIRDEIYRVAAELSETGQLSEDTLKHIMPDLINRAKAEYSKAASKLLP
jgi:hypothetical protein